MVDSVYALGRDKESMAGVSARSTFSDKYFAAERLDETTVDSVTFAHCTFLNLSFKRATITGCAFSDCIFVGCYFRRSTLASAFTGCRFIDCDFSHVAVLGASFKYSRFRECFIAFKEIKLSLPMEPNLNESLCRNLGIEATKLGFDNDAHAFRLHEIRAREQHLHEAICSDSEWYRTHFDLPRRISAGVELMVSILNRHLWGYGERARTLVRNI